MSLSNEHREYLTRVYGELAEELSIFYTALVNENFDEAVVISIITAILAQPEKIERYKENISRSEKLKRLRENMDRRKAAINNDPDQP